MAPRRLQKPDAPEINKFSTGRKHQLLAVDGYIYRWAQTGNECDLYYCQHYNVDSETHCQAALHYWSDGKITFLKERHMHVHGKEHEKIKAMEAKEKLMKLGEDNPLGRPRDLISQAITDSEAIAKLLPKKKSLEKLVQRSQLKKRFKIRCTSLEDIDIDAIKSCRTDNGQPILAFDTGFSHGVRAIGFSTPACLELFAEIEILSCDGTFKAKPRIFGKHGQVYSMHAKIRDRFILLAVVLMSHKTSALYEAVLNYLPDMPKLKVVLTDFEKAQMNAFRSEYPLVEIFGCAFHFIQAVIRKLAEFKLLPKKKPAVADDKYRALMRFPYLCMVPISDVSIAFDNMFVGLENFDIPPTKLEQFKNYMAKTWVGFVDSNQRSREPLFSHELWNALLHIEKANVRCNNHLESWNRQFTLSLASSGTGRPSVSRFVNVLIKEQNHIFMALNESHTPEVLTQKDASLEESYMEYGRGDYDDDTNLFFDKIRDIFAS